MNFPRLLLVLVLVLLLPLRGVMAAALPCAQAQGEAVVHTEMPHAHAAHAQASHGADAHANAVAASHDHASHDHASHDQAAHDDASHAGGCSLCASGCHAAALVSAPVPVHIARLAPAQVPAAPDAPAADFLSDGPERPPRPM